MKKNIEITGEIADVTASYVGIRLHICDDIADFFTVDTKEKEIITKLNETARTFLKIKHTYEDYITLIEDLGLEIPSKWKKHWKPTLKEATIWYYFVDSKGKVERNSFSSDTFDNELIANFNAFPTRELAEKAVNLSKLGRLILLWQYANDCLFAPDWKNNSQRKHFIKHDHINNTISCNFSITAQLDIVYFKTSEQVEAFIEMYETEIKKIQKLKELWG